MSAERIAELFPDGRAVPDWFFRPEGTVSRGGREFPAVEAGVLPDRPDVLQTEKIQRAIDAAAEQGGGTLVFTPGVYLSGSLFFRPGVHLRLEKDAVLLGSAEIADFALLPTRMEGRSVN